jgi:menaquinone C8-methyltransferase
MLEKIVSRYVYSKSLEALDGLKRSALPPMPPRGGKPLQVYLHVPFCEELCGYCTFNRQRFEKALAHRYFAALREEIAMYRERGYTFDRLYIGGGTPTVLPEELVRTIALVRSLWNPDVISVETHPDHLTEPLCALIEEAGVNRLSVGVQSFQETVLRGLARRNQHIDGDETRNRLTRSIARFKTVNVDMIYRVPGQTTAMLKKDILAIRELLPDQVTFYPLMAHASDSPPDVPPRKVYALIVDGLSDLYHISSGWTFSLNGKSSLDEYIVEREDYSGLGAGSFGYIDGVFYANTFSIPEYIRLIGEREFPVIVRKRFLRTERMRYHFLMKLFGGHIDPKEAVRKFGFLPLVQLWKELLMMAAVGGMRPAGRFFRLTERGHYLSMLLMREFMSAVSEFRESCRAITFGKV